MKTKFKNLYMDWAKRTAQLSHARRLHVGAVIVKDDTVISYGYNGMPAGWDNDCEDRDYMSRDAGGWLNPNEIEERWPFEEEELDVDEFFARGRAVARALDNKEPLPEFTKKYTRRYRLKTKPEVLHAESNAIAKLARSTNSGLGADLFVTHSPCIECSKLIFQSGIRRVFYAEDYRDDSGIQFLKKSGVEVVKHNEESSQD